MKMYTTSDTKEIIDIDFNIAEKRINKLQKRISVAFNNNDMVLVKHLQHTLLHSRYAKALAVKAVLSNDGARKSGIDNVIWNSYNDGYNSIFSINYREYKPMPLKRTYFKHLNGKIRPLGIPTITDRAMQTLCRYALEPIAEITADDSSFAYRKNRSNKSALMRVFNIIYNYPELTHILKIDIHSCFDNISHEWILENIPFDERIICKMLKCGYIDNDKYHRTDKGIPQGGCLSSVLCNMTLDGIDALMYKHFEHSVKVVRYADDIVIFVDSPTFLRAEDVLSVLSDFLDERSLKISKKKSQYGSLSDGFEFLGCNIKVTNGIITCLPKEFNIEKYMKSIYTVITSNSFTSYNALYEKLTEKIGGWFDYYNGLVPAYKLNEIEFDTIMCIHHLTGNTTLTAEISHKVFKKYTYIS